MPKLKLSLDGGKSFSKELTILEDVGLIRFNYVFPDGSLIFAGQQKVYYSDDWLTYQESTVLDIARNPFVAPQVIDNFSQHRTDFNRQVVSGVEMYVWGNYVLEGAANVWYTVDKGATVKSAFKFGTTAVVGGAIPTCRHVHNVNFNPADSSFWVQTGDEPTATKSHWIKGTYNTLTDVWTWTLIGSGNNYKSTCIVWVGDDMYWSNDKVNGGVKKCLYTDAGTPANHTTIKALTNDCSGLMLSPNGLELVATISRYNGTLDTKNFYYSPDLGVNWYTILATDTDLEELVYSAYGMNDSKGRLKVGRRDFEETELGDSWNRLPSVFLAKYIREQGFPDAWRPV